MDNWDGEDRRSHERRENELTPTEVQQLRKIMEADRSAKLLWATVRNAAVWIAAVATAMSIVYQGLADAVKHLAGK